MIFFWHAQRATKWNFNLVQIVSLRVLNDKRSTAQRKPFLNDTKEDSRLKPNLHRLILQWKADAMAAKNPPKNKSWLMLSVHQVHHESARASPKQSITRTRSLGGQKNGILKSNAIRVSVNCSANSVYIVVSLDVEPIF